MKQKREIIFLILIFFIGLSSNPYGVRADPVAPMPGAPPTAAPTTEDASATEDYQVDYEEEPDAEEVPVAKKNKNKKNSEKTVSDKNSTMQGSRAKNRFVLPLKSDTKSQYKKNGVPLDVDSN